MPERMHAVVQKAFGGPEVLEVAEVDRPVPLGTEVLVRVEAVGVNPVEPLIRSGRFPLIGRPPFILGWDISGVIEGLEGVTRFEVGDEVYGMPFGRRRADRPPDVRLHGCGRRPGRGARLSRRRDRAPLHQRAAPGRDADHHRRPARRRPGRPYPGCGRRFAGLSVEPDYPGLEALAGLIDSGQLRVHVQTTLPLAEAAKAHQLLESGRTTGKIVLTI